MNHDYQALIPSGDDDDEDLIRRGDNSSNDDADDDDDNGNGSNGNGDNGIINRTTMSCTNSTGSGNSDSLLWDQLNDEQSREVQNHQSRFHPPAGGPLTLQSRENNPISIALSIANQTVENASNAMKTTSQRAQIAYREWQQQQQQQQQYQKRRDRTDSNISDEFDLQFGISHDLLRNDREECVGGGEEEVGGGQGGHDHQQHSQDDDNNNNKADNGGSNSNSNSNSSRPLQGYPFVLLKEGRDIPSATNPQIIGGSERDRWGMVGNIDIFLSHLYKYYYNRGITPMICSYIVETICLLFTLWLSRLLLIGVDWMKLLTMNCDDSNNNDDDNDNDDNDNDNDEGSNNSSNNNNNNNNNNTPDPNNTCYSHLSDYARTEPLSWIVFFLIQGYTFLVLSYTIFNSWMFYQGFGYAIQCRTILHDKLGLSERKLLGGALDWNDVVSALIEGQNSGRYKIIHHHTATNTNTTRTRRSPMSPSQPSTPRTTTNPHDSEVGGGGGTTTTNPTPAPQQQQSRPIPIPPPPVAFALNPHEQPNLDPLSITQRIMRKDNYMISFWNQGYMEKSCRINKRYYWCSTLEFAIYQCILNFMFNHKMEIRPSFCLDSKSLEKRLKTCAIFVLVLEPFLLVFTIIHFILRHVYDSKTTQNYMGNFRWSSSSKWIFREYNELPHYFEKRIQPSYKIADEYCNLFGTSEYITSVGLVLKFIGGSIGSVLLVLGIIVNDSLLLHVQLLGRNLVWYAGIAGITYSVGKSLTTTTKTTQSNSVYASETNLFYDMDTKLKQISHHTHYYPYHWKNRGWDSTVYTNFKTYFDSEVKLFVYELVALLLTPYILYFNLSILSSNICEFCLLTKSKLKSTTSSSSSSAIIPGGGDVCGYSTFDFETFTDEAWDGRTLGRSQRLRDEAEQQQQQHERNNSESLSESIMRIGNVEDATRLYSKPKSKNGKMEKSFLTFKKNHGFIAPSSSSCNNASALVDRDRDGFEDYRHRRRESTKTKLSRSVQDQREHERELHVEAATKQLDTLARIEEKELQREHQYQHYDPQDEQYHHQQKQHQQQTTRSGNSSIRWNENHYSAQHQHQQQRFPVTNPHDESLYTSTSTSTSINTTHPFGYNDNNRNNNNNNNNSNTTDAGRQFAVPQPKTADAGAGICTQPSSAPTAPPQPSSSSSSAPSEISNLYPTQSAAALMNLLNNNNNDAQATSAIAAQQHASSPTTTTTVAPHNDRSTQNQYLERFHEHLIEQQQQDE